MSRTKSVELFERSRLSIPGGVNSPVRAFKSVGMNPLFIQRASGSKIHDADGNEYIDYVGSWGPMILGHAHPEVAGAVTEAIAQGTSFGAPTEREVQLAEMVKAAVPSVDLLRFVNSGNEASQGALRVARGFTGRDKIVKFEGCYHGSVDALLVKAGSGATTLGVPDSAGVPASFVKTTLLAEFNNLQSVIDQIEEHSGEVAAVLLEAIPGNMGVVAPELAFLQGLRSLCDREGIVLIFDEVMTGFRVALGGAQSLFEITPDLSIFGKIIGAGFPVGAYGGRSDIMEQVAPLGPVYQAGTLSGNPVAMAAGIATLGRLQEPDFYAALAERSRNLMEGLQSSAKEAGIPMQVTVFGGMMGMFFSDKPVRNYQEALATDSDVFVRFFRGMLDAGIYLAPSPFEALFMSSAHSDDDVAKTQDAARKVLTNL
ncbi:MAG: glutamate-1-semialdehyde 2,1-aminomutase [SAR324 cluster bacterium]|nr:glutamate-1-semialdehyde 2,1-aminomutase [SAR324 cluster bacterium]MCZ6627163.1 glutamate-1-semialdehyde 2,1-aminomutase [SAR324 cluster bacterium]MCZ6843657.1 glutamate-1-semialdehyde 2,1-aminomutase [SAR324 cluster bacterium]